MVEFEETKRSLVQREEDMRQMMERLQILEESQERKTRQEDGSLEEPQDIKGIMEVKRKMMMKNGEGTIMKIGATIINNTRRNSFCKVT